MSLTMQARPDRQTAGGRRVRQSGAVLMVALVMIFIMTILGVSAMRGATLESRLADNALQKEITFQAAESSTDLVLARPNVLENIICRPAQTTSVPEVNGTPTQVTEATLMDGGLTNQVGYSLGGAMVGRRFVVTGTSDLPGASTRTVIAQGVVLTGINDQTGGCA